MLHLLIVLFKSNGFIEGSLSFSHMYSYCKKKCAMILSWNLKYLMTKCENYCPHKFTCFQFNQEDNLNVSNSTKWTKFIQASLLPSPMGLYFLKDMHPLEMVNFFRLHNKTPQWIFFPKKHASFSKGKFLVPVTWNVSLLCPTLACWSQKHREFASIS